MCCDGRVNSDRPEELRTVAERLAAEAAAFVRRRRAEVFGTAAAGQETSAVRVKSSPTDPVSIVDTETEQFLRDRLAQIRPGESILGEEQGGAEPGDEGANPGALCWVVDPIDGTVNFLYGIPAYAVSVAVQRDGVSVAGAVADVAGGEIYSAAAGGGAHLLADGQRRPLRCSQVTELSHALLATGFGYQSSRRAAQAALLAQMLPQVRDVRRIGAAALDLCMVAAGRLDAYYEHGLNVWDWAAGALIAAEAGAFVALPKAGGAEAGAVIVAAAPRVAAELMSALD
ncbi:MAG: hypothetical protein RL091_3501, partial [Verrucomicrobiota bacterium]